MRMKKIKILRFGNGCIELVPISKLHWWNHGNYHNCTFCFPWFYYSRKNLKTQNSSGWVSLVCLVSVWLNHFFQRWKTINALPELRFPLVAILFMKMQTNSIKFMTRNCAKTRCCIIKVKIIRNCSARTCFSLPEWLFLGKIVYTPVKKNTFFLKLPSLSV